MKFLNISILVLSLLAAFSAKAASTTFKNITDGDFDYKLTIIIPDAGTNYATITGYSNAFDTNKSWLEIPDVVVYEDQTYPIKVVTGLDNCQSIKEVRIGKNVKTCRTFKSCRNLKKFEVDPENEYLGVFDNAFLCEYPASETQTTLVAFAAGNTGDITIPEEIESIIYGTFNGCDIDKLTFTKKVYPANELIETVFVYSDDHEYLGWEFPGKIRHFGLSDYLTSWNSSKKCFIEGDALYFCFWNGFKNNISLYSVAPDSERSTLVVNDQCTYIDGGSIASVKNLKNLVIPTSVKKLSMETFMNKSSLRLGISNIKNIVLGDSMTYVGLPSFDGNVIKNIYCKTITPPEVEGLILSEEQTGLDTELCAVDHLYVPEEALDNYKNDPYWGRINEITAYDFEETTADTSSDTECTISWKAPEYFEFDNFVVKLHDSKSLETCIEQTIVPATLSRAATNHTYTFSNLEAGTNYWVTIEGIDTEGETAWFNYSQFATSDSSGINHIENDIDDSSIESIFGIDGISRPGLLPGINIVKTADGKIRKIIKQ